jgi:dihydroorotate dehydrogenase
MKTLILSTTAFLYATILKPILFLFPADTVHAAFTVFGRFLGSNVITRSLVAWCWQIKDPKLEVTTLGITFPNMLGLSAGFDYNGELTGILPALGFGWHTIGTVTLHSYKGNPKPQLDRLPNSRALIVNKGLKNEGAATIIRRLENTTLRIPTGISIGSTNKSYTSTKEQIMDILQCFLLFENSRVHHSYYELNISCPNTFGGEPFTEPNRLHILLSALDNLNLSKPVLVKMPIDQSEAETLSLLKVVAEHKTSGVIFGNLTKDHHNPDVSLEDKKTWDSRKGNLSGTPTFARSSKLLELAKKHYAQRFVLVGTGGIMSTDDLETKRKAGAQLVQLITGMIYHGPQLIGQLNLHQLKSLH